MESGGSWRPSPDDGTGLTLITATKPRQRPRALRSDPRAPRAAKEIADRAYHATRQAQHQTDGEISGHQNGNPEPEQKREVSHQSTLERTGGNGSGPTRCDPTEA